MPYISKAEREKIPSEDYGLPQSRLYPIRDQKDLDDAKHLIGKHPEAKARIIAIAKRKGLTLPKDWKDAMMSEVKPARFSVDFADAFRIEGDFAVYDNALLFEAGSYPDHDFEISPEEMADAVAEFKPVAGNLDHTEWLKGSACEVTKAWPDKDDPWKLRGQVKVPVWLNSALKETQKKLSAEWDRTTRKLSGIALTPNPAVKNAALVAAFAESKEHRTPHGQSTLQTIHDYAARSGAICDPDPDNKDSQFSLKRLVNFISHPERRGLQRIHNAACKHGASCNNRNSYFGNQKMPSLLQSLKAFFKTTDEGKAAASEPEVAAFLASLPTDEPPPADATKNQEIRVAAVAEFKVQDTPEFEALFAQTAALQAKDLDRDANAWADEEIRVHKRALPKERPSLVAQFKQAAADDRSHGTANFSGDFKSRLDLLKASVASRPQVQLYTEFLAGELPEGGEAIVLHNKPASAKDAKPDPKEIAELRKHSEVLSAKDRTTVGLANFTLADLATALQTAKS